MQFIAGVTSQFKYCFAWTLAEASATFSGLNFWGWDDKSGKARWCVPAHTAGAPRATFGSRLHECVQ